MESGEARLDNMLRLPSLELLINRPDVGVLIDDRFEEARTSDRRADGRLSFLLFRYLDSHALGKLLFWGFLLLSQVSVVVLLAITTLLHHISQF